MTVSGGDRDAETVPSLTGAGDDTGVSRIPVSAIADRADDIDDSAAVSFGAAAADYGGFHRWVPFLPLRGSLRPLSRRTTLSGVPPGWGAGTSFRRRPTQFQMSSLTTALHECGLALSGNVVLDSLESVCYRPNNPRPLATRSDVIG